MPEGKLLSSPAGQTLAQLVDEWLRSLSARYSTSTVTSYKFSLNDLLRYLRPLQTIQARSLTRRHIEGWHDQMSLRKLSQGTRSQNATAVRNFLRWAEHRRVTFGDPNLWLDVPSIPVPERYPNPIPDEDLDKVLSHLEALPPTLRNLRDRALFHAFIASGAKIGDMLRLARQDLSRIGDPNQRGGRTVAVPKAVVAEISEYLDMRTDGLAAMWVTLHPKQTRPLAAPGVLKIWERLADRVGIGRFTSHQLRDTTTLKLIEADIPYADIAEHRGNKRIEPLRKYARILAQRRQRALDAMEHVLVARPTGSRGKRSRQGDRT